MHYRKVTIYVQYSPFSKHLHIYSHTLSLQDPSEVGKNSQQMERIITIKVYS